VFTSTKAHVNFVQLNSFGCGLDAVTTDQVEEILRGGGKIYTVLKIDEVSNLGAAKIRIRSLHAALQEREKTAALPRQRYGPQKRKEFTKAMRKNYTILAPQMAPIHFPILQAALRSCGYNLEVLPTHAPGAIDEGLKYVNNDACYPAIMAVGQYIVALKSGKYDLDRVSVLMTQTGGVCRASNYVGFIRKALRDAGYGQVPVIAMSAQGIEKNSGFTYSPAMLLRGLLAILYGDLIMRLLHRVRPYEKIKGSANILAQQWIERCSRAAARGSIREYNRLLPQMVQDFAGLEIIRGLTKPKVGVVGEIYVKYHPLANNNLVEILEAEGAEAVVPDMTDFLLYSSYGLIFGHKYLSKGFWPRVGSEFVIRLIEWFRQPMRRALRQSARFSPPDTIYQLIREAKRLVSLGNQYGEGWLLTAEMLRLIQGGAENIVCIQPFGCLPNHITGKGVIKGIRDLYPQANIAPIDYDASASEVNQLNRIKLMLAKAPGPLKSHSAAAAKKALLAATKGVPRAPYQLPVQGKGSQPMHL
ncbi:MAG: 2-hydroxyglutaryl-CoA dehydratase, partial [Firmicutes bacterium]|nr:2-hydroxyglutaryl-CoA dehydratase [Bacillota bacterium]